MNENTKSPYPSLDAQHSATLAEATDENSAPCRGTFFAYDSQGGARGICGYCEQDADVHEFDLPQDDE